MPSFAFRKSMTAAVDEAIHVTVFDGDGNTLDPDTDPVEWSDLSDTTDVEPDDTGYLFTSSVIGFDVVTATIGGATESFTLRWIARTLKFTAEAQAITGPES